MTRLADLMDLAELDAAIADGLVRAKRHPELPLTIYNYAEKAVYTRTWTPVTTQCRGLIVHDNGDIIARPWPKFFNYGEREVGTWGGGDVPVQAVDKLDGSLGILYGLRHDWAIATRGSFASDQAIHATQLYNDTYRGQWTPPPWLTVLFEIVYPDNRIVCDYGDTDDLILLGAVDIVTGEALGPDHIWLYGWPGPRAQVLPEKTIADVLKREDRAGVEGVVCRVTDGPDRGLMFKLKQADYVAAHRVVTGLNAVTVWEAVCAGRAKVAELLESLPDEFHRWVLDQADGIDRACERIADEVVPAWLFARKVARGDRKAYADIAKKTKHPALMFALLDGKDIRPMILKTLKPSGADAPRTWSEAAA